MALEWYWYPALIAVGLIVGVVLFSIGAGLWNESIGKRIGKTIWYDTFNMQSPHQENQYEMRNYPKQNKDW